MDQGLRGWWREFELRAVECPCPSLAHLASRWVAQSRENGWLRTFGPSPMNPSVILDPITDGNLGDESTHPEGISRTHISPVHAISGRVYSLGRRPIATLTLSVTREGPSRAATVTRAVANDTEQLTSPPVLGISMRCLPIIHVLLKADLNLNLHMAGDGMTE